MTKRTQDWTVILLLAWCTFAPAVAWAGGFEIFQQSARSMGMGGVSVTCAGDPTTIHVNPAGISLLEGTHLSFGSTLVLPSYQFTGVAPDQSTTKMLTQIFFPPSFSVMHTMENGLGFGFSTTVPFMLQTEWDQDWVGSRIATKSQLRSVFFSPAIAFSLSPYIAVGVGLNLAATHVQLSRRMALPAPADTLPDGAETMQGDSRLSLGYQISVLLVPNDVWTVGAVYQSRVRVDIDNGQVLYTGIPASLVADYPDIAASSKLNLPESFQLGLGCTPLPWLSLGTEIQLTRWSAFNEIDITIHDAALSKVVLKEEWKDAFSARGGIEFRFADIRLRAGVVFEQSPATDSYLRPSFPDADGSGYTAGLGYTVDQGLTIDFAFAHFNFNDRTVVDSRVEYLPGKFFNGLYSSSATTVALTVAYSWE